ncbi:radical SAM protein [Dysgonomonas sp. GY75]|uniref:radical SAM/SPASM domain-containing protein n=1 Tax=Dysgonomonas sp. GY75 TaxID=2780419 RepID=UPI0018846AD3|nr:radical SAM protein [Dysgonomonas sp. GY75]MBF0651080.1 radical SAM protein [Dysgonomonas sp. GY75]
MQFSKYVHFFYVEKNVIGIYHSLLIKTVFIDKEELQNIELYFRTNKFVNTEIENSIKYLYQNYFIIKSNEEDNALYDKCTSLIFPSAISNTYIVVTENCNFNCKYCFISETVNANKINKVMTQEGVQASVALLQRTYERQQTDYDKTITFYGGEPLLNYDIIKFFIEEIELIKRTEYWPDDVRFAIITNGSLLTSEIIEFLKANRISIGISYDIDKSAHSNRISKNNKDTFDIVREKIELCKTEQIPFSLSITITENIIKNKEAILEEILKINPTTVAFNLLIPNHKILQNNSYYENATGFMIDIFKVLRKQGIYEDRVMRKVQAFSVNKLYLYDCCASGGNQYTITPSGEIGICHGYLNNRKYFSANVFDKNFDFRENIDFNYWKKRSPLFMEKCFDCECLGICGGGCPYAAEYMYGSIYELDERFCIHAKKLLKWLIDDLYDNIENNS